jgi:Tfp pilus assembly protein PilE
MLNRRGITLIEMLIVVVMLGLIGAALGQVFTSVMGSSSAQVRIAATQGEARVGTLLLPQELREIGFDTNTTTMTATTDLISIASDRIEFFASRGLGITCGTPTLTEFRIRRDIIGQRIPLLTDRFLLFLEFDVNAAFDDQWVPMQVTGIDLNSTCDGSDPAITFTLAAAPEVAPSIAMALTNHRVGGPLRWFERVEYGTVTDGTTGEVFVGRRSVSLGEAALQPIIGPLTNAAAFSLVYYNAAGTVLNPASANPLAVRSIELRMTTSTNANVSLGGSTRRANSTFPVVTRVSLRNSLRP